MRVHELSQIVAGRIGWSGVPAVVFAALLLAGSPVLAQNTRVASQFPPSNLARQNMERVAASAAQIEAVLHKDAGLMVALKRWVANDATDHGQLISDSDLTDQAIYRRLENDLKFRSIATVLLQRFGYLLPRIDPNSPQGEEQTLLIEDRAKWLAQDQEEQLTAARQQRSRNTMLQAQTCDPRLDSNCAMRQSYPFTLAPPETGEPFSPPVSSPSGNPPTPSAVPPTFPMLEKAKFLEAGPGTQVASNSALAQEAYGSSAFPLRGSRAT